MHLTKSNFLIWHHCPHNAWMKVNRRDVYDAGGLSAFDQNLIETGNEVDELARDLFPGGELIFRGEAARTRDLIAARAQILYQPVFQTDRFEMASDILVWNEASARYDVYEVKASTSNANGRAREELYIYDLGFQAEILRACGVDIGRLYLVRLDSTYVRGDALDIAALFKTEDYTDRVAAIAATLAGEMQAAHIDLLRSAPLPAPCNCIYRGRGSHCTTFAFSNPTVPAYSVHDLSRIGASRAKLAQLIDSGILAITDVPDGFTLSDNQRSQVVAAKTGRATIDTVAVRAFLEGVRYPLSFIDYETYPAGVPRFARYHPYEQIPFQFSLDIVERPGAEVVHREFLFTESTCPDTAFAAALEEALPTEGSIVTWNDTFEKTINSKLADRLPTASPFLAAVNSRVVDLMDVFSTQAYVHPAFRGSTSIKAVLPALVPELSYENLVIQEGAAASDAWDRIVRGEIASSDAEQARRDLLTYCALDTRAMVEIWWVLEGTANGLRRQ